MRRMTVLAGACVLLAGASIPAQQARGTQGPTLQSAIAALNVTGVRSIKVTANGRLFGLGQPPPAAEPGPLRQVKASPLQSDSGPGAMRVEQVLPMPTPAPRGGGGAIAGEQRQVQFVRGAYAWNETQPAGGGAATFTPAPN